MPTVTPHVPTLAVAVVSGVVATLLFRRAGTALFAALGRRRPPERPIRDAIRADGPEEFTGRIHPVTEQAVFDAPFSGERAVLGSYTVQERHRTPSRAYTRQWADVERGSIVRAFVVADETERVKVEAAGATVETGGERPELVVDGDGELPDAVRLRLSTITDAIADLGAVLPRGECPRARRFLEGQVTPGERVHVTGVEPSGRLPRRRDVDAVFTAVGGSVPVRIATVDRPADADTQLRTGLAYLVAGLLAVLPILAAGYLQFVAG